MRRHGTSDLDADGYTSASGCLLPSGDCNDADATIYPGSPEICDGIDNDCDQVVDTPNQCVATVFGDWAEDVELARDLIFVAAQSDGLYVMELTPTGAQTRSSFRLESCRDGSRTVPFFVDDVEIDQAEQTAYLALGPCGFAILDIDSVLGQGPAQVQLVDMPGWTEDIEVLEMAMRASATPSTSRCGTTPPMWRPRPACRSWM